MFKVLGIFWLSFACITGQSVPKPAVDIELNPRQTLYKYALDGISEAGAVLLQDIKNIFERVLKDETVKDTFHGELGKLNNFVAKINQWQLLTGDERTTENFKLLIEYTVLLQAYINPKADASEEFQNVLSLLRKYNIDSVFKTFIREFNNFLWNFDWKYAKYMETLTLQRRSESEKSMKSWYRRLKAERNQEKKIAVFQEFFILYGDKS